MCLLLSILNVEGVVAGISNLYYENSVVLSNPHEVVVPVSTLLIVGQGDLVNGNGVVIFREEKKNVWSVLPFCGVVWKHPRWDFGSHEAFCIIRLTSIHNVDSLVSEEML